jgi:hypothetical protein
LQVDRRVSTGASLLFALLDVVFALSCLHTDLVWSPVSDYLCSGSRRRRRHAGEISLESVPSLPSIYASNKATPTALLAKIIGFLRIGQVVALSFGRGVERWKVSRREQ